MPLVLHIFIPPFGSITLHLQAVQFLNSEQMVWQAPRVVAMMKGGRIDGQLFLGSDVGRWSMIDGQLIHSSSLIHTHTADWVPSHAAT